MKAEIPTFVHHRPPAACCDRACCLFIRPAHFLYRRWLGLNLERVHHQEKPPSLTKQLNHVVCTTWIRWSVLIHSLSSDLAVMLRPWNSSDVLLQSQMDFHRRMKSVTKRALAYVVMYAAGHGARHDKCMFDSMLHNSSGQEATEQTLNDWGFKKHPKRIERAENITHALNVKLILPMNEFSSSLSNHLYSFCIKQRFTVKTQPRALSLSQNSTFASLENRSTTWATAAPCSHNLWPPRFLLLV